MNAAVNNHTSVARKPSEEDLPFQEFVVYQRNVTQRNNTHHDKSLKCRVNIICCIAWTG